MNAMFDVLVNPTSDGEGHEFKVITGTINGAPFSYERENGKFSPAEMKPVIAKAFDKLGLYGFGVRYCAQKRVEIGATETPIEAVTVDLAVDWFLKRGQTRYILEHEGKRSIFVTDYGPATKEDVYRVWCLVGQKMDTTVHMERYFHNYKTPVLWYPSSWL